MQLQQTTFITLLPTPKSPEGDFSPPLGGGG